MAKEHLKTNIGQYAIIIKDKQLLLLKPKIGQLLVFPGGRLEADEADYVQSLKREINEETGLSIDNIEPFDIKMWSVNSAKHRYGVFFLCNADLNKKIKLSEEHIEYKWFTYEEAMSNRYPIGKPGLEVIEKLKNKNCL